MGNLLPQSRTLVLTSTPIAQSKGGWWQGVRGDPLPCLCMHQASREILAPAQSSAHLFQLGEGGDFPHHHLFHRGKGMSPLTHDGAQYEFSFFLSSLPLSNVHLFPLLRNLPFGLAWRGAFLWSLSSFSRGRGNYISPSPRGEDS